ncbi:MAG: hypothetical protein GTO63_05785 [Anaerolineae bacterium]|nr:hypothetical protein [Anaerolineae bacterium]NIN94484.1 hypothetical protein [Anaerolineae bacterium]NIQ77552.1 hypothetical protein [Anaerolineae bacterium]
MLDLSPRIARVGHKGTEPSLLAMSVARLKAFVHKVSGMQELSEVDL